MNHSIIMNTLTVIPWTIWTIKDYTTLFHKLQQKSFKQCTAVKAAFRGRCPYITRVVIAKDKSKSIAL